MIKLIISFILIAIVSGIIAYAITKLDSKKFLTFTKFLPKLVLGCFVAGVILFTLLNFF